MATAGAGYGLKLEPDLKRMASHPARQSYAGLVHVSIHLLEKLLLGPAMNAWRVGATSVAKDDMKFT